MKLHHVQVGCPSGGEADARRFWVDGVGMVEVPKPAALAGRGGAWFRHHDAEGGVTAEVHVGVEEPHRPASRAHPALELESVSALDGTATRLERLGFPVDATERDTFPGFVRLHVRDAAGNRVELLAASS